MVCGSISVSIMVVTALFYTAALSSTVVMNLATHHNSALSHMVFAITVSMNGFHGSSLVVRLA